MNPFPPHLPPPSSSLSAHRRWERVRVLFATIVLALVAGATGAALLLAWFFHTENIDPAGIFSTWRLPSGRSNLPALDMSARVFKVYERRLTGSGPTVFSPADLVGEGVAITSDGWIALMPVKKTTGRTLAVLPPGTANVVMAQRSVTDPQTGLMYIKIRPNALLVPVVFGDISADQLHAVVHERGISRTYELAPAGPEPVELSAAPPLRWRLRENTSAGGLVFGSQGALIGFVTDKNRILPGAAAGVRLAGVSAGSASSFATLGVKGLWSADAPVASSSTLLTGFVVQQVVARNSPFKKDDVITMLDGRVVDPQSVWYTIDKSTQLSATLWRAGKTISITATVIR